VPLALTTGSGRMLKVEVSPVEQDYRQGTTTVLRTSASQIILPASSVSAAQQQRPGVIVVKQHT
jgi:hypothetical protein